MAKKMRYGTKKLTPVRTLVVGGEKTLAPSGSRALAPSGSRELKTVEGRTLDVRGSTSQVRGSTSQARGGKGKGGKVSSGGSFASRTDEDEDESGSGSGSAKAKKPKGVVMSSRVVSMLTSLGVARAEAERMVLSAQLSQSNPRVGTVGPVNRRDGGAGFGRGRSGGGGQRTAAPPPGEVPPGKVPAKKPIPPLSPSAKAQQDALNSQGGGQRTAAPPPGKVPAGKPLPPLSPSATPPPSKVPPGKVPPVIPIPKFEIPPSYAGMKASWVLRKLEEIVRNVTQPDDLRVKKADRSSAVLRKALAERELGKAVDAFLANTIEFETPEEKKKTYSGLERLIRKIQ